MLLFTGLDWTSGLGLVEGCKGSTQMRYVHTPVMNF